jgi:hypothetical protein
LTKWATRPEPNRDAFRRSQWTHFRKGWDTGDHFCPDAIDAEETLRQEVAVNELKTTASLPITDFNALQHMVDGAFPAPRGVSLTELVEPCGALPRKCLFIYLFIYCRRSFLDDLFVHSKRRSFAK